LVFPTRVRRRALKHAFEEALDDAQLEPDAEASLLDDDVSFAPATGPTVGSLGDIAIASGYVAAHSLARAYDAEVAPQNSEPERPAEAAAKLKAALAAAAHTTDDLKRLRRRFAAQNHPDRVPPELRDEAVAAMAEVNAEIDRALKRAEGS
jgi:hypothetical protein